MGMCNLVKSILEGDSNAKKIPIKKVRGDILDLIVQYLKHHNGKKPEEIAKPIRSVKMERIVADKWDAEYINAMSKKTIFQVILGANYMDLPSLLHLGCAKSPRSSKANRPRKLRPFSPMTPTTPRASRTTRRRTRTISNTKPNQTKHSTLKTEMKCPNCLRVCG